MDIHLLGPIEASLDGRPVSLGAPQQRAVLAMLALRVNRTVSADQLIDGLWGESAPASAPKMVQLYVSQLRKLIRGNEAEIVTRSRGYELRLAPDRVDAERFERLVKEALRAGEAENGEAREALGLWRGDPLVEFTREPFAGAEVRRLEDLRLQAAELAIEADLAARRHEEVLGELRGLIAEAPLRERLRAQHMLALYRAGRQAEALEAYREARAALVEAIGVEPGPELRRLHQAVLRQDPALDAREEARAADLPSELDATTPMISRGSDLERLRREWEAARNGAGRLVLVTGASGIGKTRLAAELASEVARGGGEVLYARASLEALSVTRMTGRPTLLVLDGIGSALGELGQGGLEARSVLALVITEEPAMAADLQPTTIVALQPLDAHGVRAIARQYVGAGEQVPVARLLLASGGVPLHVHREASEWASTVATRRLAVTAGRLAGERPALRAAEDDLVGGVVKLQAARGRSERRAATDSAVCPFKGLASFDVKDAKFFYGREQLVAELVARLPGAPFLGIVGPSGSGKSSVLRAGLLAALSSGILPGSERWTLALLRPGEHPVRALEQALAEAPDGERLIVAVDQFEELFTACRDEPERLAFVDALVTSVRDPDRRTAVIVTLRADHYERCAAYPELSRLLGAGHALVPPMRSDELRRAVELPACRVGLDLDDALVDALVSDVEGRPGALPLLSTSMLELWHGRDGRHLRMSAYEEAGGVGGAVARLAESAYERLDPGRREVAKRTLLRLAGEGGGEAIVRRRVSLTELDVERQGDIAEVLRVLADDRLITISEGEVEVAHEALLREWPRLCKWLEDDADGRRLHRHLTHAATDWESAGRDPSELYRGARLVSALEWLETNPHSLNGLEHEFLSEGRALARLETERRRRTNRRLRGSLAAVAAMLVLAIIAGGVALSQRGTARQVATAADAQRVGAEAVNLDRLDDALLLARAGVDLHDSAATRGNLLSVLQRSPATLGVLNADGFPLYALAVSHDERLAAVGSERGTVTVFDTATRRPVGEPYQLREGIVNQLKFSPDDTMLAVAGAEPEFNPPGGIVDLIDPWTATRRRRIELPSLPRPARAALVGVAFAPDGDEMVVVQEPNWVDPGKPGSVLLKVSAWTGQLRGRPLQVGRVSLLGISASADRRRLLLSSQEDDQTLEIDVERFREQRRFSVGDVAAVVSPDARRLALGSEEGRVRLLDLGDGGVRQLPGGHRAAIRKMTFAQGGRTLVTSAQDGTVTTWDVARSEIREELKGHSGEVFGLQTAPDGRSVYSAAYDGRALVWDVATDRRLDRRFSAGPPFIPKNGDVYPRGLALSPDGRELAITQADGTVDLLDSRTLEQRASLEALRGSAAAVAYTSDGNLLAVTGDAGQIVLFDARTHRRVDELRGLKTFSQAIVFSPDGRLLAAAEVGREQDGSTQYIGSRVRLWDVGRRRLTGVHFGTTTASIAFSPDGKLIAAAALNARLAEIRSVQDGRVVTSLPHDDFVRSLAFSPDGTMMATGQLDGDGRLWSTRTWKPIGPTLRGHDERLLDLDFSRDGTVLSSAGADGTVSLWDVKTQRRLGSPLTVEADSYLATAMAPDGSHLFAASRGRRALRWNVSVNAWKRHACRVAGRALTAREWREALPGRPYRAVCRLGQ